MKSMEERLRHKSSSLFLVDQHILLNIFLFFYFSHVDICASVPEFNLWVTTQLVNSV